MRGERAVAVGLSLTLHAGLVGMVIARLALAPSVTPGTPLSVTFDAPPSIGESVAAAVSQQILPSVGSDAIAALAPASIGASSSMSALSPPALGDKGAGLELRPVAVAPVSQAPDGPAPDVPALLPSTGQAIAPTLLGGATKSLAVEDQLSPAARAADPLPVRPVASVAATLATSPTPQTASEAPPAGLQPETVPPTRPIPFKETRELTPRAPDSLGGRAVGPASSALAALSQILAEAPPPPAVSSVASGAKAPRTVPAPSHASAPPLVADARPQSGPDVVQKASEPPRHGVEAPAPLAAMEVPREAAMSSLAPVQPAKIIDLGATDIPVPPADAGRARQIRAFVDSYDGGPCFFATVRKVSASSTEIESLSTRPATFRQFDRAIKTATGVEATVSGQRIWSTQCRAVEYLRKLPRDAESGPTLDLDRRTLDPGDALSGTVHGAGGRKLRLFVIAETGAVTDVSGAMSEHDGAPSFTFQPRSMAAGGPFPQILMLVTGAATLPLHPVTVDDVFEPLIAGRGMAYTVAAEMFLVTR